MRWLVTVLALTALIAGCGSSGAKSSAVSLSPPKDSPSQPRTTTTRATPAVSSSPTYHYPTTVKHALMAHCRRGGSRSACDCVVRYFEGNFSYAQLKAASIPKLATWAGKAASVCSGV